MSCTMEDAFETCTSSQSISQCEENMLSASISVAAHYPLGSWERHLLEERLRALKQWERERLLEKHLAKECTFQPCVSTSRGCSHESQEPATSLETQQEGGLQQLPVFERLARRAKEREARLAQIAEEKRKREEEALRHFFHPHVNTVAKHAGPFASYVTNVPVEERLLHYGRSIEQSRRLLQQKQEEKELEGIGETTLPRRAHGELSKEKRQSDIADRSKQLLIERETQRAVTQQALLNEHTFRPKVCLTSSAIDRSLKAKKDISDRGVALYEEGMRRQQQRQAETARRQGMEFKGLYKPATNPLTEDWIHHGQHRALFRKDFVKRQEIYQRVREEHHRNLASALEGSERAEVPRVDQEMIERQIERLYLGAQERRKERKKRIEEQFKAQECTFRPQLAPGTTYVIAHSKREQDVVKRLASVPRRRCAPHQVLFDTECEKEQNGEKDIRTCSSKVVHPDEAAEFYYRQKRALEEREAQLRELKQRQRMEELCACTFRPRTCTDKYLQRRQKEAAPETQQPVTARVSGVSAYLQRQAEAKRLLKEQEEKYNNLGRGLPCNGANGTVIKPFNLSGRQGPRYRSSSPDCDVLRTKAVGGHDGRRHVDPYNDNAVLNMLKGKMD